MGGITPQLTALVIGTTAIVGASVAVCLGHIDAATYIGVVSAFGGVGVGAGVLHAGVTAAVSAPSVKPEP